MKRVLLIAAEFKKISKFTLVGLAAGTIHISIVWVLIRYFSSPPFVGNLTAFVCAFSVSFVGQYHWTFKSRRHYVSALWRFFLIAVAAFLVNNAVLLGFLTSTALPDEMAAAMSALAIPVFTYFAARLWVFPDS